MKKGIAAGSMAFLAVVAAATTALADPPKEKGYEYKFTDDKLLADTMGAAGAKIIVRPKAARTTLLRPRIQFVQEMLKSVENM